MIQEICVSLATLLLSVWAQSSAFKVTAIVSADAGGGGVGEGGKKPAFQDLVPLPQG